MGDELNLTLQTLFTESVFVSENTVYCFWLCLLFTVSVYCLLTLPQQNLTQTQSSLCKFSFHY